MTHVSVMNRRQCSRRIGSIEQSVGTEAGCWGYTNDNGSYNNVTIMSKTKALRQARGPRGRLTTCFTCALRTSYCNTIYFSTFIIKI